MLPTLDLESVRCFEAAGTLLNFRAAAQKVHLSPPAFGDRIRRLEEDLDVRLFDRTTRKVSLTEAGARLLPHARTLLTRANGLRDVAHADSGERPFELMIGTRYELGLSWLTPALSRLEKTRPHRRVHLTFGDSEALLAQLRGSTADAIVTSVRLSTHGVDYARLHEERYVFVGARKLLEKRALKTPEDARAHVLIDAYRSLPLFRYFLDATPAEEMWAFSRVELLGTIGAIRARVLTGHGVAVLPEYFVRDDLKKKRLVRIRPKLELHRDFFRLIWRDDHPQADRLRQLASELKKMPLC